MDWYLQIHTCRKNTDREALHFQERNYPGNRYYKLASCVVSINGTSSFYVWLLQKYQKGFLRLLTIRSEVVFEVAIKWEWKWNGMTLFQVLSSYNLLAIVKTQFNNCSFRDFPQIAQGMEYN